MFTKSLTDVMLSSSSSSRDDSSARCRLASQRIVPWENNSLYFQFTSLWTGPNFYIDTASYKHKHIHLIKSWQAAAPYK